MLEAVVVIFMLLAIGVKAILHKADKQQREHANDPDSMFF